MDPWLQSHSACLSVCLPTPVSLYFSYIKEWKQVFEYWDGSCIDFFYFQNGTILYLRKLNRMQYLLFLSMRHLHPIVPYVYTLQNTHTSINTLNKSAFILARVVAWISEMFHLLNLYSVDKDGSDTLISENKYYSIPSYPHKNFLLVLELTNIQLEVYFALSYSSFFTPLHLNILNKRNIKHSLSGCPDSIL